MPRFDVYANPDTTDRKHVPYYLDVQNDFLGHLETRVVVPLWSASAFRSSVRRLHPELDIDGKTVVMDPSSMGAVPSHELRRPVCNIASQQFAIQDALDALFGSY